MSGAKEGEGRGVIGNAGERESEEANISIGWKTIAGPVDE
jgi:hypothetical protein